MVRQPELAALKDAVKAAQAELSKHPDYQHDALLHSTSGSHHSQQLQLSAEYTAAKQRLLMLHGKLQQVRQQYLNYTDGKIDQQHKCSTDVWSWGCVLMELLTGSQRAFKLDPEDGLFRQSDYIQLYLKVGWSVNCWQTCGDTMASNRLAGPVASKRCFVGKVSKLKEFCSFAGLQNMGVCLIVLALLLHECFCLLVSPCRSGPG